MATVGGGGGSGGFRERVQAGRRLPVGSSAEGLDLQWRLNGYDFSLPLIIQHRRNQCEMLLRRAAAVKLFMTQLGEHLIMYLLRSFYKIETMGPWYGLLILQSLNEYL